MEHPLFADDFLRKFRGMPNAYVCPQEMGLNMARVLRSIAPRNRMSRWQWASQYAISRSSLSQHRCPLDAEVCSEAPHEIPWRALPKSWHEWCMPKVEAHGDLPDDMGHFYGVCVVCVCVSFCIGCRWWYENLKISQISFPMEEMRQTLFSISPGLTALPASATGTSQSSSEAGFLPNITNKNTKFWNQLGNVKTY